MTLQNTLRKRVMLDLGIPANQLNRLIARAPHTYKVYTIPKKNRGRRTIAQPAKETKYIQYWIIENIFKKLPVHQCATAYTKGSSIKENAKIHAKNTYFVKMDFKDFFTSIKDEHLSAHIRTYLRDELSDEDISDIVRVSCIRLPSRDYMCLSIGAPSSPILSNTIMYEFDTKVDSWCRDNNVVYTRYADDMTFSTRERDLSSDIEKTVRLIAKRLNNLSLRFNAKKTTHLSKRHQRRVTGLIINNEGKISLGRDRKRTISSLVHRFTVQSLPENKLFELQGLLGFAKDVEPLFLARLRAKYGSKLIDKIMSTRKTQS